MRKLLSEAMVGFGVSNSPRATQAAIHSPFENRNLASMKQGHGSAELETCSPGAGRSFTHGTGGCSAATQAKSRLRSRAGWPVLALWSLAGLWLAGCADSARLPDKGNSEAPASVTGPADSESTSAGVAGTGSTGPSAASSGSASGVSDITEIPPMADIEGIPIPRIEQPAELLSLKGEVPADVGNTYIKPGEEGPVTGDSIRVRFNAEPKSLNPITEQSAYQSYIGQYIQEGLLRQNQETFEFEPNLAKTWVAEDAVKLSADYPGLERRIALADQPPEGTLEVEFLAAKADGANQPGPTLKFTTSTLDGQPKGKVWVGLFPIGQIPGVTEMGYHFWSADDGSLTVSGIQPGRYRVHVGEEVFGKTEPTADGGLVVTPLTEHNPLATQLKSQEKTSLTLSQGQWVNIQQQTVYTYELDPRAKWSDGQPFTTRDLAFGYEVINNDTVDGEAIRTYYENLLECTAVTPLVVRMRYRFQYFKSLEFTMGLAAYCPPRHVFDALVESKGQKLYTRGEPIDQPGVRWLSASSPEFAELFNTYRGYNESPLGTGPYRVANWTRDERVELERNPDYWNPEHAGHLDKISFVFISDDQSAFQAFKAGQIDFLYRMNVEQYFDNLAGPPEWFKEKQAVKAKWYTPAYGYIGWNQEKPLFQDRRVRVALSLLFDKAGFLRDKMHGAGVVTSGSEYYFGPAYDHSILPLAYDPETAVDLLTLAGWSDSDNDGVLDKDGKPFEFSLNLPPGNPLAEQRISILQKNLKDIGIKMDILKIEWATFIERVKARSLDAMTLSWAMSTENDPFQIWHSSGARPGARGSNHVAFRNAQADELIENIRITLDKDRRRKLQHALHRVLDHEQPYMFLFTPMEFGAYDSRYRGVKWYRLRPGFDLSEWYVPKSLQKK